MSLPQSVVSPPATPVVDAAAFLAQAAQHIGARRVLTQPADTAAFQQDWRGRYQGQALAVLQPGNTAEVAAVVALCAAHGVAVVPQGGNTGLTGGAVALPGRPAVLLNLSRLNRIRTVDPANNTLTAEAGCVLATVREAAASAGRQFPLLLGSVGSCQVGGLVSTNAGGTGVLRYGNMRQLVLGLEVVLPDGQVWNGLRALRKDNAGYDLKQLFIGAEGTLGVITAAVLALHPPLRQSASAGVGLASVQAAVDLLRLLQDHLGERIEAFEILSRSQVHLVQTQVPGLCSPLAASHPYLLLVEVAAPDAGWDAGAALEAALGHALEAGLAEDAALATDLAKAQRLWDLRHHISEANKRAGFTVSNDTSVPVGRLPEFIAQVTAQLEGEVPGITVCHAGHIGDGNIHVIGVLAREVYATPEACEAAAAQVNRIVHEASVALGGSISAEHGIGLMHVARLERSKPALDLALMRQLKAAFDPAGVMNPGKIFRE
ncbi:FAD-binding oxidoreductase [Ideonella livida]|uniref:FAD-binding oxidoreductase n=1 Tax=Ideonella livida TaxID=2707176 RepID=A0A7C9PHE0_9BURK|nr:FAD-binding oxidoreductase [Ideonella livida]NDY92037.1 FAD-binding oxidoreductase [Ideonella livida]